MQKQLPVVARIIALHGQGIIGARIAAAQVDHPGVVQGRTLASNGGHDAALAGRQYAAAIDVEYTRAAAAVTEHEIAGEVELRTVVQVDGFPIDVTGGAGGCGVVEG